MKKKKRRRKKEKERQIEDGWKGGTKERKRQKKKHPFNVERMMLYFVVHLFSPTSASTSRLT